MKHILPGIALLLSSLAPGAPAQTAPSQSFQVPEKTISLACPVGMQAQQRGSSQLVEVRSGKRMEPTGQRISLTLRAAQSPRMISARVTVRGLTPKAHVLQSKAMDGRTSQISQTMSVGFSEISNGSATGELVLPGFTSVTSIGLEEITYENGTLWRVEGEGVRRVAPDLLMLISDR